MILLEAKTHTSVVQDVELRNESTELWPTQILTKVQKQFNRGKIAIAANGAGTIGHS